jgi:hypothetical protein
MIEHAISSARTFTIIIRIVSFFLMVFGILLFFSPITQTLGYFPLIGGFLQGTVTFIILLGAIIICIPLYIITLSLAWLFYHPKVGAAILGIGLIITGVLIYLSQSKSGGSPTESTAHHLMWNHYE